MKILYLYQFFRTPDEGGILRAYYLATALAEAGHEVTVLTAHPRRGVPERRVNGFTVRYLPVAYDQRFGFGRRVFAYLKFAGLAFLYARRMPRIDCVYAASVPLTVGLTALGLKALRGTPYFFEVGDLWPQTPVEMGVIRSGFLKKTLYGFEAWVYRRAETVVAVSPTMQAVIEKRGGAGKTVILPNLADCQFFRPAPKSPALESRFGTENRFVVTYFGAMGRVVGLEALLDLARYCAAKTERIRFLLVGDGSERPRLRRLATEYGLPNLRFLDPLDKNGLREVLAVTDVAYVSFLPLPVLQTNCPNKLVDALAAGKPVLTNLPGWHADLLRRYGCGWYAPADQPGQGWQVLEPLLRSPTRLADCGRQARRLAETEFDRRLLGPRFAALFGEKVLTKKEPGTVRG
jgi:glycosyltransferase involved in cell wall biosynthesis